MYFTDDGVTGWIVGTRYYNTGYDSSYYGYVLNTRDGGRTWKLQYHLSYRKLNAISMMPDGQSGWVVGERGTILATVDGGKHWHLQDSGTPADLNAISVRGNTHSGWIVGAGGIVLYTSDGGEK